MPDLLTGWLVGQRWYAAKGTGLAGLHRLGSLGLAGASEVGIEVHIVRAVGADGTGSTYQIPLTYRRDREPDLAHALVGSFSHPDLGERWVYDAPHDPAFVAALLDLLA